MTLVGIETSVNGLSLLRFFWFAQLDLQNNRQQQSRNCVAVNRVLRCLFTIVYTIVYTITRRKGSLAESVTVLFS